MSHRNPFLVQEQKSNIYNSVCKKIHYVYHISNVTLPEPELYANAENWSISLHYSGTEDTNYVLYRRLLSEDSFETIMAGKGTLMYKDNDVKPNYTYVYQLMIQDKAGNASFSPLSYVKSLPVDDREPKAVILDNATIIEGYETIFNGGKESTDNDKIVKYSWDFGDGSEEEDGPNPTHTYQKAGEYKVTLTVTDRSGNTGNTTIRVTVKEKESCGKAKIEVRNTAGTPLSGVTVYVNASEEHNETSHTGNDGRTEIIQNE